MLLHLLGRLPVRVQFLVAFLFNELVTTSDMHLFVSVQTLTDENKRKLSIGLIFQGHWENHSVLCNNYKIVIVRGEVNFGQNVNVMTLEFS